MKKLQSTSKKLDTLFKILQKITLIGMGIAIIVISILTIVNWLDPNAVIGEDFHTVDIGPITLQLAPELAPSNGAILAYAWIMIALGAVCAAVLFYAFGIIRKILHPMIEGRPFDEEIGHHIKRIGYVVLILGVMQNVASLIETASIVQTFGLTHFAGDAAVRSITVNYTIDLSFLVVFFILLLLSYVFHYGAELQQLSDETL